MVVIVITIILLLITTITFYYLQYRGDKVIEFRSMIRELCFQYALRHPHCKMSSFDWFIDKYTFKQMLFSVKPQNLKYWYTKEELDKICN